MTPIIYDGQVIANSVVYAALGNWFIKTIKKSNWVPFINEQTYWFNKLLAVGVAFISALGVTYTYSYTGDGVFTLVLGGLTFVNIWANIKVFIFSYALQQTGYKVDKFQEIKQ